MTVMSSTAPAPRPLDHLVLPVADLGQARSWLSSLGFLVALEAIHPFGTKNACVFFADGTYLEPLAVADDTLYAAEARAGNLFVSRDAMFRTRCGKPGLSGIALRSLDATADLQELRNAGSAEGDVFTFSREFQTPAGERASLSFRLAFAQGPRSAPLSFFLCERVASGAPAPDRSALAAHPNTVSGIARLVLSAPDPADFEPFLRLVLRRQSLVSDASGLSVAAGHTSIEILTPSALQARYGIDRRENELRGEGIVLAVRDVSQLRAYLDESAVFFEEQGERLLVRLAPGGGCFIAFEPDGRS